MKKFNYWVRIILVAGLLSGTAQGLAQEKAPVVASKIKEYDVETLKKIMKNGPFLAVDETAPGYSKPATAGVLIKAPFERVWKIVNSYEGYPERIPSISEMKILEKKGNAVTMYFKIVVMAIGPITIGSDYTLTQTNYKDEKMIRVTWISGSVKNINGWWEFIPIEDGKETLAFYTVSGDYRHAALGANFLFSRQPELETTVSLSGNYALVKAVKEWAESPPEK